uniref:Uncharacterized protein n=1 Tax=Anopheles atroparvus TaxID=41427 RepID=A0A182JI48_ANOAO
MSETKVNVASATDLLLLGESAKDVPPKEIARAVLKGLCHQESDIGLYECLFTSIIHHFEPKEFEADVSCIVLPQLVVFLEKIQKELQTNALSYFFVENLTILLRLADVLQKLIEYLVKQAERCQLYHSLAIFPEYLLRCYTIVRQNYIAMAKESNVLEAMKTLYAICKKILMAFLDLLCPRDGTTRGSYFLLMDNEEEYECLEKVCTLLASVGNEISPIDSLLASDVWKAIVKLSTEHAELCVTSNRTSWLSQIILTLNSGIDTTFNEIRIKNEASKQATISLKLNAFFLRVMLKLLSLLKPHTTPELFHPIVATLLQIKASMRPNSGLCSELVAGIDQYLHIGYMAIVESSIRSESFAKEFCQHECKTTEEIHSFYTLLMHVIGQVVSNANDSNLVAFYCYRPNLLAYVCTLLKRSDSLLLHNTPLYKQLLTHCSGLILMGARLRNRVAQKTIEETLVRMVLQEHYHTALLGIDLWSVFVRYHSTQLLFGYFVFWKKIHDHYSLFRTRPQQVYVAQLLRNLWVFLPATQKGKLLDTYPVSDKANDRLWATTVPLSGEIDEVRRKLFVASVEKRLQNGTNLLQQRPTVEGFYEMLGLLLIGHNTRRLCKETLNQVWNTPLDWHEIWNTPTAGTLLHCLEKSTEKIPDGMLHSINSFALSDSSAFVKCMIVKLVEKANSAVGVSSFVEPLLMDDCLFIVALAYTMIGKLNEKQHSGVQQLLVKSPHIKSQLAILQQNKHQSKKLQSGPWNESIPLSVSHHCRSSPVPVVAPESCGDMTMVINSKIDELFPDDDDEDDSMNELDIGLLTDTVSGAKKRKVEEIEQHPESPNEAITRCLCELEGQGKLLEKLVQSRELKVTQRGRLQSIISTLAKALDS